MTLNMGRVHYYLLNVNNFLFMNLTRAHLYAYLIHLNRNFITSTPRISIDMAEKLLKVELLLNSNKRWK
jgi:hypothetical protein